MELVKKPSNGKYCQPYNHSSITLLSRWNPSVFWCQKGCDFSRGRMSDDNSRLEATKMCQMMTQSTYALKEDEDLDNMEDMRIHATMYPNNASNLYRACVAGIRRQKY